MKTTPPVPTPDPAPSLRFHHLRAKDVMQRELVVVHASDPLREVERTLIDAQISAVPVVDDAEHVLGTVSMRDVVSRYADDHELPADADPDRLDDDVAETETVAFHRLGDEPCAGELMTTDVVSCGGNTLLSDIAARMVDHRVHRVLVLDRNRLVGLVSTMDLLGALAGRLASK